MSEFDKLSGFTNLAMTLSIKCNHAHFKNLAVREIQLKLNVDTKKAKGDEENMALS